MITADGSFSLNINTASPLMKYDGEYKIKATYGDAGINDVIVVTLEGGLVKQAPSHSGHEEGHHEAADFTKQLDYNISGGMVESITATGDDSLLVSIHMADDNGELTITLSEDIITPFNDGTWEIIADNAKFFTSPQFEPSGVSLGQILPKCVECRSLASKFG